MRFVSCFAAAVCRSGRGPAPNCASSAFAGPGRTPLVTVATLILAGSWTIAAAQPLSAAPRAAAPVTIIAGTPEETSLVIANDLAAALGDASGPRILPIVGHGGLANMTDLVGLAGIDLAITQTDTLDNLKSAGTLGPALERRIGIVAKLHDAELHILAGKNIERVEDLAGKTVNLCAPGSGTEFTARAVLDRLGIRVRSINVSHQAGLAKVASGEIAATLLVTGKPSRALQGRALPEGVKLLGIPFLPQFDHTYMPATFTEADYPGLIPRGQRVDTLAVGVVLAAPIPDASGSHNDRVSAFVDMFFSDIATLHMPTYHPKWHDTNLTASLPGWSRHPAAESWLKSHGSASAPQPAPSARSAFADATGELATKTDTDPMLAFAQATRAANGNPVEQERLFRAFIERSKPQQPAMTASSAASP